MAWPLTTPASTVRQMEGADRHVFPLGEERRAERSGRGEGTSAKFRPPSSGRASADLGGCGALLQALGLWPPVAGLSQAVSSL